MVIVILVRTSLFFFFSLLPKEIVLSPIIQLLSIASMSCLFYLIISGGNPFLFFQSSLYINLIYFIFPPFLAYFSRFVVLHAFPLAFCYPGWVVLV